MNGNCILPIVTGFVSGCPLGAKTTCDLFTQGKISQNEAQRLLCFTNNSSPLFIVGTVGVGMLGSASDGYKIMLLHYLTAILTGVFLHIIICKKTQLPKSPKTKAENIYQKNIKSKNIISENIINQSIWNSMETILKIGGCIILFCVISSLINSLLPIMFGSERFPLVQGIVSSFLEVTNGCHALSSQKNATLCCACAIAWGGISIHTQTADFVHNAGLKMMPYIISKAIQTLLMLVLGLIFL
jgi:sporulation integral membrane protein YlbJ